MYHLCDTKNSTFLQAQSSSAMTRKLLSGGQYSTSPLTKSSSELCSLSKTAPSIGSSSTLRSMEGGAMGGVCMEGALDFGHENFVSGWVSATGAGIQSKVGEPLDLISSRSFFHMSIRSSKACL